MKYLTSGTSTPDSQIGMTLSGSGKIVMTNSEWKKRDASEGDIFRRSDTLLSVISWNIQAQEKGIKVWLDKGTEMSYAEQDGSGLALSISQWRAWIDTEEGATIKLKHIDLVLEPGSISLVEQQKQIFSIAYMLKGSSLVRAWSNREYTLEAWKGIKISQSNIVNPWLSLSSLVDTIDDSIKQNPFFLSRNGQEILDKNILKASSWSLPSLSGSIAIPASTGWIWGKYISLTSPIDGSIVPGWSLKVEWKILSPLVSKVMINEREASINKSDSSFSLIAIPMNSDTLDIVYKAYDASSNLLERWVLTLYSKEKKQGTDKLIPTTFPAWDKLYRITSPLENPFKTTTSSVTVSGTVPKGSVEYITVNNFRLKKFSAYGSNWYYYANIAYGTMKEGFNLYEIRFYGSNDTLLSTQLFTIIKEWGTQTLSWE
jgi:hypothetical protein